MIKPWSLGSICAGGGWSTSGIFNYVIVTPQVYLIHRALHTESVVIVWLLLVCQIIFNKFAEENVAR